MNPNATIVSVFHNKIVEQKPGLNPQEFVIPAAPDGGIAVAHIPTCINNVYIDADRGSLRVPEFGEVVARAIVRDFCNAQLEFRAGIAEPGLFYVPGILNEKEVLEKYKTEIDEARKRQAKWYEFLVRLADNSWNKRKNHTEISELQRMAATKLKLNREWLIEYVSI